MKNKYSQDINQVLPSQLRQFKTEPYKFNNQEQQQLEKQSNGDQIIEIKLQTKTNSIERQKIDKLPMINMKNKSFSVKSHNKYLSLRKQSNKTTLNRYQTQFDETISFNTQIQNQRNNIFYKCNQTFQLSNFNKHNIEFLIKKYYIFLEALQNKSKETDNNREILKIIINQRRNYYNKILERHKCKWIIDKKQEQSLNGNMANLKIQKSMREDLLKLKAYAKQFNCYLYRKGKFYSPMEDIHKNLEAINIKLDFFLNKKKSEHSTENNKQDIKDEQNMDYKIKKKEDHEYKVKKQPVKRQLILNKKRRLEIGREYLSFSRQVGIKNRQIMNKQKGKIKFIKQRTRYV